MRGGFSFSYARRAGLTRHRLRELRRAGQVEQLTHGAFVHVGCADRLAERARAVSRALPSHVVVTRRTAAWLWGLDVLPPGVRDARWPVEVAVPPDRSPPRRPGCRSFLTSLPPTDLTEFSGVRLTTLERTALDCGRWLPRAEAVAALDQFLRSGVSRGALTERAALLAGRRNARRLREVIEISDAGAMLPGESWTRTLIVDAGLPRPVTQIPTIDQGRRFYLDMGYEEFLVAVEYDGEEFHTRQEDRAHDDARRTWLRTVAGWEIIVVTREDVLFNPVPFLSALTTALMERGWTPTPEQLDQLEIRLAALRRPPPS